MVEQIEYGTHENQHYDVYENQQAQFNAWIVLIHGGYWRQKYSKSMMDPYIDFLLMQAIQSSISNTVVAQSTLGLVQLKMLHKLSHILKIQTTHQHKSLV
ncbi:hypothetical protein [Staphylococcus sp. 191]|uniref:hypothetical protein n=1 Tax=Staphylococcus sp. 191 TaxID=2070016 RepID=UPI001F61EA43|nr:hypothetical protein [Staphylococcus sp. 191]